MIFIRVSNSKTRKSLRKSGLFVAIAISCFANFFLSFNLFLGCFLIQSLRVGSKKRVRVFFFARLILMAPKTLEFVRSCLFFTFSKRIKWCQETHFYFLFFGTIFEIQNRETKMRTEGFFSFKYSFHRLFSLFLDSIESEASRRLLKKYSLIYIYILFLFV